MLRVLIAILSCHRERHLHANVRNTWLKDIPLGQGVDAKFFLGRRAQRSDPAAADEVFLNVPDDSFGVSQKTLGVVEWAFAVGYDFVFKCDNDTYVHVQRLLASGFENFDYSGHRYPTSSQTTIFNPGAAEAVSWNGEMSERGKPNQRCEAYGGAGYWLSRKAMGILLENRASTEYKGACEDWWVGAILRRYPEVTTHNDNRYRDYVQKSPAPWNDSITCHEHRAGDTPREDHDVYGIMRKPGTMVALHRRRHQMWQDKKVLIAVHGYVKGATNGEHEVMRQTCFQEINEFPLLDYRFFIGNETPTGEDESGLWAAFRGYEGEYKNKALLTCAPPLGVADVAAIRSYVPKDDEVIVNCPDGYVHLPYKTRESIRWALERGYDYIFECFPDSFFILDRLMSSGFENFDYTGMQCDGYAAGGCGYWISAKAARIILDEKIVTDWAEDRWVGKVMKAHEIPFRPDARYVELPSTPLKDNDKISTHLNHTPAKYTPAEMVEAQKKYAGSPTKMVNKGSTERVPHLGKPTNAAGKPTLVVATGDLLAFKGFHLNAAKFEPHTKKILVYSGAQEIGIFDGWQILRGSGNYLDDLNLAIETASPDDVVICSPTLRFTASQTSSWLQSVTCKNRRIGVLSPKVLGATGVQGHPILQPHLGSNPWSVVTSGQSLDPLCLFILRDVIRMLNRVEDTDLSRAVKSLGLISAVTPHKTVTHA